MNVHPDSPIGKLLAFRNAAKAILASHGEVCFGCELCTASIMASRVVMTTGWLEEYER